MKILVTGANGFVGTNLRHYLEAKGHVCLTLDVASADFGWDDLARIPFGDLDAVVHLAGLAHDLKKVAGEQRYFDVNVGLTERIFTAAAQARTDAAPLKFIYFSSSKAASAGTAYARSKWAAEQALARLQPSPLATVILRPAMIHGPGNKGNLNLLWNLARHGLPWPLAAFGNRRSFTSVGNACAVVEALACAPASAPGTCVTYALADDEPLATTRLIELIAEACGRRARLWRLPKGLMRALARLGDILHLPLNTERLGKLTETSLVDNATLKRALGWTAMPIRAEDGLRLTLNSFKEG